MKTKTLVLAGAVAALITTGVAVAASGNIHAIAGRTSHRSALAPPSTAQVSQLRALGLSIASKNGETAPTNLRAVATTFVSALTADTGASAPSNQDVFMVSMNGHFIGHSFDVPPRVATPTGTVMTFEFDPATGNVVGVSIGNLTPDLAQLGAVTPLQ
jgi:hypothetical protein